MAEENKNFKANILYDKNENSVSFGSDINRVFLGNSSDKTLKPRKNAEERIDKLSGALNGNNHKLLSSSEEIQLKNNDKFKLGDTEITITSQYGMRNLPKRGVEHSTGIDYVTNNGKAIAFQDCTVEAVKLQGDGKVLDTSKPVAGYYVVTKNDDGSKSQYMHLDPISDTEIKNLVGKRLKKGDQIWGYTIGSGSMTGKHVKVRTYTGDNPLTSYINPSLNLFK